MLTDAEQAVVDAVTGRLEATTGAGDWHHCKGAAGDHYCVCGMVWSRSVDAVVHMPHQPDALFDDVPIKELQAADSIFIAHAPQDVRALLSIIERLRAENEALTARLERPF